MNDNVQALKSLYIALGGESVDVEDLNTNVEVLNAISEKFEGEGGATSNPVAIKNIAAVAENIGGGGVAPTRIATLIPEQTISGERDELEDTLIKDYAPTSMTIIYDGTTYVCERYNNDGYGYGYGAESHYDESLDEYVFDWSEYPFFIRDDGLIKVSDTNEHTVSATATVANKRVIYGVGEFDVSDYATAEVHGSGTININKGGSLNVEGYYDAYVNISLSPSAKATIVNSAESVAVFKVSTFEELDTTGAKNGRCLAVEVAVGESAEMSYYTDRNGMGTTFLFRCDKDYGMTFSAVKENTALSVETVMIKENNWYCWYVLFIEAPVYGNITITATTFHLQ